MNEVEEGYQIRSPRVDVSVPLHAVNGSLSALDEQDPTTALCDERDEAQSEGSDNSSSDEDNFENSVDEDKVDERSYLRAARRYLREQKYEFARYCLTQALRKCPIRLKSWGCRALCQLKMDQFEMAVADCTNAIKCLTEHNNLMRHPIYVNIYIWRAQSRQFLHLLDEAVKDMEVVTSQTDSASFRDYLEELRIAERVERAKPFKDHYLTLGITTDTSQEDMKAAYYSLCIRWHPDRWAMSHAQLQADAEEIFKEINLAYQVLKDPFLKFRYHHWRHARALGLDIPHPYDCPDHVYYQNLSPMDPVLHEFFIASSSSSSSSSIPTPHPTPAPAPSHSVGCVPPMNTGPYGMHFAYPPRQAAGSGSWPFFPQGNFPNMFSPPSFGMPSQYSLPPYMYQRPV